VAGADDRRDRKDRSIGP